MLVQHEFILYIKELESDLADAKRRLAHHDAKAVKLYNESIDPNTPNMYILAWSELSEAEREVWRWKAVE